MLKFEEYLAQFTNTINVYDFLIALLVTALLSSFVRWFYIRFGDAISNRKRFANNFLPLALGTMLIITIVKSSIALSLGLVGALSIVRFRAAIKDPEELTYLFLIIGLGLATGANHIIIAILAIPSILLLLYIHKRTIGKTGFKEEGRLYVNIETDTNDLEKITGILTNTLKFVELKRMDTRESGLSLSFIAKADSIKELNEIKENISAISNKTTLSIVEQPDLIL